MKFLLASALLFALASAEEGFIRTKRFATTHFHEFPEVTINGTAGLATGWSIFTIIIFVSCVLIVIDSVKRNNLYNKQLESARLKMRSLGINIEEADKEFARRLQGLKDEDENDNIVEQAA